MDLPPIDLMINSDGDPMVRIEATVEITDLDALFKAVPGLSDPAHATMAADAVNHLSEGFDFNVIHDPEPFALRYFERLDAEAEGEWQQGQPRLRDFGRPDLSGLDKPSTIDGTLTFYAEDGYLGLVYKVTAEFDGGGADYQPVPMSPM